MTTVEIKTNVSFNELIKGVEQLDFEALEKFVEKVLLIRAKKFAPAHTKEESVLLAIINKPIPATLHKKFQQLEADRKAQSLSGKKQTELTKILHKIEKMNADRLEALVKLSKIQQKPLKQLMVQFGVGPKANYG